MAGRSTSAEDLMAERGSVNRADGGSGDALGVALDMRWFRHADEIGGR